MASRALSAMTCNLPRTTVGCFSGVKVACDENPQSLPAITFWGFLYISSHAVRRMRGDIPSPRSCRVFTSHPVWLKYCVASSGLSMVGAEQSTEAFSPHHVTRLTTHCSLQRDASVGETLMIALGMIVGEVRVDHMIQGACTQHDHPFQGLLYDGAYELFAVRMHMRTAWRQEDRFHTAVLAQRIKRLRALRVPVVEQRALTQPEALTRIRQLPGAWLHAGRRGMGRDAGDLHAPCGEFHDDEHVIRHPAIPANGLVVLYACIIEAIS